VRRPQPRSRCDARSPARRWPQKTPWQLSWGQRLLEFETPQIAANNRQGKLTLHNDARLEGSTHVALLVAGLYGLLAPFLVRRRTALVPPRTLGAFFAVVVAYYTVRLRFLDAPTYVEAKYSEWPETCFALALALWCAHVSSTVSKAGASASLFRSEAMP
jgi:hypothetical protein